MTEREENGTHGAGRTIPGLRFVLKGMNMLDCFDADDSGGFTVASMARASELSVTTTRRYLATGVALGIVGYDSRSRTYFLIDQPPTRETFEHAIVAPNTSGLVAKALWVLSCFADLEVKQPIDIAESTNLSLPVILTNLATLVRSGYLEVVRAEPTTVGGHRLTTDATKLSKRWVRLILAADTSAATPA